jgi:FkbM family methyltransferase
MRQRGSGQVAQYGLAFTHALKALGRDLANRRHEPEVRFLSHVLTGAPTCLHLGASDGRHSFSILKAAPGARIYAFEPASFDIQALQIGVKMRGLTGRIVPVQAAVGEAAAETVLVTPKKKSGKPARAFAFLSAGETDRADFQGIGHFKESVRVVRLDDYAFDRIDFIRMDIEGAEYAASKGAMGLLERDRPHMLIEIHSLLLKQRFNTSAEAVAALYRGLGYRFFAVVGDDVEERRTLEPAGAHGDFFLIHPARSLPDGPFREAIGRRGAALEQLRASG